MNITISSIEVQIERTTKMLERCKKEVDRYPSFEKGYENGLLEGLEMKICSLKSILKRAQDEKKIYDELFKTNLTKGNV